MKTFVVVEGEKDRELIQQRLPAGLVSQITIIAGGGKNSAGALASSLLVKGANSVALVIDANTTDRNAAEEQRKSFLWLLGSNLASEHSLFEVFVAVPSLEAISSSAGDSSLSHDPLPELIQFLKQVLSEKQPS